MKVLLMALAAMAAIAVGADLVLDEMGFSAEEKGTGSAVRLDDS